MDEPPKKKTLDRLRTGVLERNFTLGKITVGVPVAVGWIKLKGLLTSESSRTEKLREYLKGSAARITEELSGLKGSLMKAGQVLSVYGEQFLPPEINDVLRALQSDSTPVEWPVVEQLLRQELGARFDFLEVEQESVGAASLGQVHRAVDKRTGAVLALKVRYPGVEKAIDSDLWVLRRILSVAGFLPRVENLDSVFDEARRMLRQEVDYVFEAAATKRHRDLLETPPLFIVPRVVEEFSTAGVLCTTFERSHSVKSGEVLALSQERRNALATSFFELYLRELLEFGTVQSDAHFGNFGVRLGENGAPDRWVLYDFGAVRDLPPDFQKSYRDLIKAALHSDRPQLLRCLEAVGLTQPGDAPEQIEALADLCELGLEGIRGPETYRWAHSTLPARVAEKARSLMLRGRVRVPRPEMLSVDRKTSGVFVTLATLRAELNLRPLVDHYLLK